MSACPESLLTNHLGTKRRRLNKPSRLKEEFAIIVARIHKF
jgi:hypothetical protein